MVKRCSDYTIGVLQVLKHLRFLLSMWFFSIQMCPGGCNSTPSSEQLSTPRFDVSLDMSSLQYLTNQYNTACTILHSLYGCFVLRYGIYLGLLQDNSGTMNDLHMVLSTVKMQLKTQQYSNKPTLSKLRE